MTLIDTLKNNSEMRKIFGKRELAIIEKQLWGIRLTPSEKNRLSRDIRKKFEAIAKLTPYSKEFNLKKGHQVKDLINDAKEYILESKYKPRIKKIILFGSTVENQRTFRSDIDIAVELDKTDIKEATEFRIYIAGRISSKIDIQVYNVLPEKIKKEIDQNGKILYKK